MSEVKRWGPDDGGMVLWCDRSISHEYDYTGGTYVRSTDYDAAIRERDEAEAAVSRYEDTINERDRQLDEARAELAKVNEKHESLWRAHLKLDERFANLRSAIEAHNARCEQAASIPLGTTRNARAYLIPLPPSAAPAASEPKKCKHPNCDCYEKRAADCEPAEAGAGPKCDFCCIDSLEAASERAWRSRNTRCGCDHNESCAECFPPAFHKGGYWDQQRALLQQSASLPVVPWNGGYAIRPTHEAADAFWKYWRENGETHKHGYYESTWGAINAALRAATSPAQPKEGK